MFKPGDKVLVCTDHTKRGVFFGVYVKYDAKALRIQLRQAQNCVYWSKDVRGFLGLASVGPSASCRIGPPADVQLEGVTCIAKVTAKAAKAWKAQPWN